MNIITKYFTNLSTSQKEKFQKLEELYKEWNSKINVISRKDTDFFYERHVLHSLALAKILTFKPNSSILDIGTGGGFPGIPLAILFENCTFTLVDSIAKKINVVNDVAEQLELSNVKTQVVRAENINQKFDFIVSRAVTKMEDFVPWTKNLILPKSNHSLKNGILYLKGGDLTQELEKFPKAKITNISDFFEEDFFETKKIVYLEK